MKQIWHTYENVDLHPSLLHHHCPSGSGVGCKSTFSYCFIFCVHICIYFQKKYNTFEYHATYNTGSGWGKVSLVDWSTEQVESSGWKAGFCPRLGLLVYYFSLWALHICLRFCLLFIVFLFYYLHLGLWDFAMQFPGLPSQWLTLTFPHGSHELLGEFI